MRRHIIRIPRWNLQRDDAFGESVERDHAAPAFMVPQHRGHICLAREHLPEGLAVFFDLPTEERIAPGSRRRHRSTRKLFGVSNRSMLGAPLLERERPDELQETAASVPLKKHPKSRSHPTHPHRFSIQHDLTLDPLARRRADSAPKKVTGFEPTPALRLSQAAFSNRLGERGDHANRSRTPPDPLGRILYDECKKLEPSFGLGYVGFGRWRWACSCAGVEFEGSIQSGIAENLDLLLTEAFHTLCYVCTKQETACRTCGRANDVGVKVCWCCGNLP